MSNINRNFRHSLTHAPVRRVPLYRVYTVSSYSFLYRYFLVATPLTSCTQHRYRDTVLPRAGQLSPIKTKIKLRICS